MSGPITEPPGTGISSTSAADEMSPLISSSRTFILYNLTETSVALLVTKSHGVSVVSTLIVASLIRIGLFKSSSPSYLTVNGGTPSCISFLVSNPSTFEESISTT